MKLNTVNVIELTNGVIQGLTAYPETPEGNKAAEEHFTRCVNENNKPLVGEEDAGAVIDGAAFLEDGTYNSGSGYEINLVHST